jgi:phosphoribosylglycinamide formyltransferase-1
VKTTKRLVLFASGSGSNVENIAKYFAEDERVVISGVLCNNPGAGVVERCKRLELPLYCFNRPAYLQGEGILALLKGLNPNLIVLAGFLWKIPESLITAFPDKIINIHPALLPKYGGKGMYGMHVHNAVIEAGEKESGITIHRVDKAYDQGSILVQKKIRVLPKDTAEDVAGKIHILEYAHYPPAIASLLFE